MAWYCKLHVWCCFWPNACPVFATYTSALLSIAFFFVFFLCLVYFTYYAILWYYYWMYLKIFHSCVAVNAFIKGQLFERSRASLDFSGDPVLECMLTWELSWVHCVSEKKKKVFFVLFFCAHHKRLGSHIVPNVHRLPVCPSLIQKHILNSLLAVLWCGCHLWLLVTI